MLRRVRVDSAMRQGVSSRLCFCVRNARRLLSTATEHAKRDTADDDKGWPMKFKVAGGLFLGTFIPWLGTVAIANDAETREVVAMISPGLVQWLRDRRGGHFWDEDPKRLDYLAHAAEWINQPVTIKVQLPEGESRPLRGLDARMPFTDVGRMVRGGNGALWLTDFDVLDEDIGEGEPGEAKLDDGFTAALDSRSLTSDFSSFSPYSSSSSSSSSAFAPFSVEANALKRDIRACNIQSWWDIAAMEEEQKRERLSPPTSASQRAAEDAAEADQARAMEEHLGRMIEALEQDKLTGARTVDDVEAEVRSLRKQQRELRRKHRKRFMGLF